ncbi:MAG: type I-E CRISPR-associated protein Cse2/CasB [Christensenellaceae bacterium]|nr:type I-E CRISPR-associated protein Cse2/CasB [Christensenellaceae bacterium]
MSTRDEIGAFVARQIAELDKDEPYARASLAKLRRAVGKEPSETPDVWGITLSGGRFGDNALVAVHTALSLYAVHRQSKPRSMHREGQSLGKAARTLILKEKSKNRDNEDAITRRFNAIASAGDLAELSRHALGLVQLLRSEDVEMDYPRFAQALYGFTYAEARSGIRLNWGRDFYSSDKPEEEQQDG